MRVLGDFSRPVDSCALAACDGGFVRQVPAGGVAGVKRLGLVDDLACNLGRFASKKFVQHLSGGGRVGDSRVGLRVIQPNMVKQGGEFVGAQGHHLLSQGDGIYEWEVDVLPV